MQFVDEARIYVKAGDGGKGCESFYRDRGMRHPRPDGGDGGKGGDVIFVADRSIHTLLDYKFKQHYKAKNGSHGSGKGKLGRSGEDCILKVPMGTLLKDHDGSMVIKDLVEDRQSVVVARGGVPGRGNASCRMIRPPGRGEERTVELELKVMADVGLIGYPNAGKSTIINKISRVSSRIANYPFTTKRPVLGYVAGQEGDGFVIADLPGLIEGAHKGKGLGDRFLRHVQRTRILVQVIDMAATEGRDPVQDYRTIQSELRAYSRDVQMKRTIVVANKMDVESAREQLAGFRQTVTVPVIAVSAQEGEGLDALVGAIKETLK